MTQVTNNDETAKQRKRPARGAGRDGAGTSKTQTQLKQRAKTRAVGQVEEEEEEERRQPRDSDYHKAKDRFGPERRDEFYEWLRENRLNSPDLCLGFYLERAKREENLTQRDVAERTGSRNQAPITRGFLSAILGGRSGILPPTWRRIADALNANVLEFYIAEGWIDPSAIAAYQVPQNQLLVMIANEVERVPPDMQTHVMALVRGMISTLMAQRASMAAETAHAA